MTRQPPLLIASLPLAGLVLAALIGAAPAPAASLAQIKQLEDLINATVTETLVSATCPPDHAGYYEHDGERIDRLVLCSNNVDLSDVEAVWEVMAHEATHIMQACTGSVAIADALMPRTYRELQTRAPHYAKLLGESYRRADQRLETEAFWMELQKPERVIALFRDNCKAFLGPRP